MLYINIYRFTFPAGQWGKKGGLKAPPTLLPSPAIDKIKITKKQHALTH